MHMENLDSMTVGEVKDIQGKKIFSIQHYRNKRAFYVVSTIFLFMRATLFRLSCRQGVKYGIFI